MAMENPPRKKKKEESTAYDLNGIRIADWHESVSMDKGEKYVPVDFDQNAQRAEEEAKKKAAEEEAKNKAEEEVKRKEFDLDAEIKKRLGKEDAFSKKGMSITKQVMREYHTWQDEQEKEKKDAGVPSEAADGGAAKVEKEEADPEAGMFVPFPPHIPEEREMDELSAAQVESSASVRDVASAEAVTESTPAEVDELVSSSVQPGRKAETRAENQAQLRHSVEELTALLQEKRDEIRKLEERARDEHHESAAKTEKKILQAEDEVRALERAREARSRRDAIAPLLDEKRALLHKLEERTRNEHFESAQETEKQILETEEEIRALERERDGREAFKAHEDAESPATVAAPAAESADVADQEKIEAVRERLASNAAPKQAYVLPENTIDHEAPPFYPIPMHAAGRVISEEEYQVYERELENKDKSIVLPIQTGRRKPVAVLKGKKAEDAENAPRKRPIVDWTRQERFKKRKKDKVGKKNRGLLAGVLAGAIAALWPSSMGDGTLKHVHKPKVESARAVKEKGTPKQPEQNVSVSKGAPQKAETAKKEEVTPKPKHVSGVTAPVPEHVPPTPHEAPHEVQPAVEHPTPQPEAPKAPEAAAIHRYMNKDGVPIYVDGTYEARLKKANEYINAQKQGAQVEVVGDFVDPATGHALVMRLTADGRGSSILEPVVNDAEGKPLVPPSVSTLGKPIG